MGLLDFLGLGKLPEGVAGSTLVVGTGAVLDQAGPLLAGLSRKFGQVAVGVVGAPDYMGSLPTVHLPDKPKAAEGILRRIKAARLVLVSLGGEHAPLVAAAGCPAYWINVSDWEGAQTDCKAFTVAHAALKETIPDAVLTGDPLLDLRSLPEVEREPEICERFKEQRDGGRWVGYFAGTGEDEEEEAYPIFNRLIRHRMGLMVLAPRDQNRCEPVYREAIKYRLQTIRHRRLSTSFIPIRTRVYYVEDAEPLEALYRCVDFVVAGGTVHRNATNRPDIISPILHGKPVVVGPAHRDDPVVRAAVEAAVVLAGESSDEVFERARHLLDEPEQGRRLAERARDWLESQVGALDRVLDLIH